MSCKIPKADSHQYTIISKQSVKVIGEIAGFDDLPGDVIDLLCEEVNYRIREVTQLSLDIMKQARRKKMLVSDINVALESLDVQPVFGYGMGSEEIQYMPFQEGESLFYPQEKVVDLFETSLFDIHAKFMEPPSIKRTWLAINGLPIQNTNANESTISWPSLTEDESQYLDIITNKLFEVNEDQQNEILKNVYKSSFLNHLLPHILNFVIQKVEIIGSSNIQHLLLVLDFLKALIMNKHINFLFAPFLNIVVSIIRQCQVGVPSNNLDIWDLQESACCIMSSIIRLWDSKLNNIHSGHEEFLLGLLSGPSQPLYVYCGAITGLLGLNIQSLRKCIPHIFNLIQQILQESSSSNAQDVDRMLEISKLALEKILKHYVNQVIYLDQSHKLKTEPSFLTATAMKDVYLYSYELFGDSISIKLPCINFPRKTGNSSEDVTLALAGKELFCLKGEEMMLGIAVDGKEGNEDIGIKATLSDPQHGIKLKISKYFKQSKDAHQRLMTANETFSEAKSKRLLSRVNRNQNIVPASEAFDGVPLKNRNDVVISFRFKNQSNLNTFTEKRKAEILARNMTRQYASMSRYRELCNSLQPFSRCYLLFKLIHMKDFKKSCSHVDASCAL